MKWRNPLTLLTLVAFLALTLCAAACAFSAQTGAASQISVPCGPIFFHVGLQITPTLKWAPDGSGILFTKGDRLYTVALDGSTLYNIADSTPRDEYDIFGATGTVMGLSADISPDGSRVVYTTCEYLTEPTPWHHKYVGDPFLLNYELATAEIDGSDKDRLTENLAIDHYPTWSPDGSRVAFVSNVFRTESEGYDAYRFQGVGYIEAKAMMGLQGSTQLIQTGRT